MIIGIAVFAIFVLMAALMYLNRLPALLALPVMAVAIAAVAGAPGRDILEKVIAEGAARLHVWYTMAMVGAVLAVLVERTGIAHSMIRAAAELGGDRPALISALLLLVAALLFTVMGGLGAVILVATIVLPILLSVGISPMAAGCLFLFALSLGGVFNLLNWQAYAEMGVSQTDVLRFAVPLGILLALATVAFGAVYLRRGKLAADGGEVEAAPFEELRGSPRVGWYAWLTPIIPILLVAGFSVHKLVAEPNNPQAFEFPLIAAMVVGILYGLVATWRPGRSSIQLLSRSVIEGIGNVAPAVALMIGIGMLVNAVTHPAVSRAVQPLLEAALPASPARYVAVFGVLAPLALYRGPLNLYGMGFGLAMLMKETGVLPLAAIMAALFSVGLLQGVCDPTNTHNVWIANHLGLDVQQIMRRTLPFVWAAAIAGLAVGTAMFFR